MLKWLRITAGALAALLALAWIAGSILPREHVATSRVHLRQPPERVWAAITDHAAMVSWRTGLRKVERGADQAGKAVWVETSSFGEMPLRVEEAIASERYVLAIAGDDLPFGGTWTYQIEPAAGGARISITEDGFVAPALFRVMSRLVFGHHASLDQYLRDLGRRFGETVTPEHVR
jgi:hypothetical protein